MPDALPPARVRVFVDFWNFQLSIKRHIGKDFPLDWKSLGPWFAAEAAKVAALAGDTRGARFDGMHVYLSYNPRSRADTSLKHWALNTVDRFPGVQVRATERKRKGPPECPSCHQPVATCPTCHESMEGTIEKGVDTAIVTDMIKLAWADSYDIAVLVSSDRDFIPAVEFLDGKGHKVVHAGFPPHGTELARCCWGSFDVRKAKLPTRAIAPPLIRSAGNAVK